MRHRFRIPPPPLLLAALSITAWPAAAAPTICTRDELERRVEVIYADPGQAVPCEVLYDKGVDGSQNTLWRASREAGYCEAKAASLVDKLTMLGWSCSSEVATATAESPAPD